MPAVSATCILDAVGSATCILDAVASASSILDVGVSTACPWHATGSVTCRIDAVAATACTLLVFGVWSGASAGSGLVDGFPWSCRVPGTVSRAWPGSRSRFASRTDIGRLSRRHRGRRRPGAARALELRRNGGRHRFGRVFIDKVRFGNQCVWWRARRPAPLSPRWSPEAVLVQIWTNVPSWASSRPKSLTQKLTFMHFYTF
jgi:hypothetical protein